MVLDVEREFSLKEQEAFAAISGDYNPIHLDHLVARRTAYGHVLVHGCHIALWALDVWIKSKRFNIRLNKFKCIFHAPLRIDEKAILTLVEKNNEVAMSVCDSRRNTLASIKVEWVLNSERYITTGAPEQFLQEAPDRIGNDMLANYSGECHLTYNRKHLDDLLPNLVTYLANYQISQILAISRMVGMKCPGHNSLLSRISLLLCAKNSIDDGLMKYRVKKFNEQASLAQIEVSGYDMEGTVDVFRRPNPVEQLSFDRLKALVEKNEFLGQTALVIGGSRGLGNATTKLLVAGNANVFFTFNKGLNEADALKKEILREDYRVMGCQYDISGGIETACKLLANLPRLPDSIFYFPTPAIFSSLKGNFSAELFNLFCSYYITGFVNIVDAFTSMTESEVTFFIPSTVAIENTPLNLGEYVSAKLAAEATANFISKIRPSINVYVARLPRLPTDQTASIVPVSAESAAETILDHLRELSNKLELKKNILTPYRV
jgi:hypothetical protein